MFDEVILATIGVLTLFQAQTRAAAGAAAAVPGSVAPQTLRVRGYTVNPGPIEGPVIAGLIIGWWLSRTSKWIQDRETKNDSLVLAVRCCLFDGSWVEWGIFHWSSVPFVPQRFLHTKRHARQRSSGRWRQAGRQMFAKHYVARRQRCAFVRDGKLYDWAIRVNFRFNTWIVVNGGRLRFSVRFQQRSWLLPVDSDRSEQFSLGVCRSRWCSSNSRR